MSYSGAVEPGGPSAVRVLDEVEIRKLSVGSMDNNAYLVTCRHDGAQLLIDAADDPDRLIELVREGSGAARLDVVVTTHRHADHVGALRSVVAVTGATTAAGADDADAITAATDVPITTRLLDGDTVVVGHATLEVVALRGHTQGSIALVYREPVTVHEADAAAGRAHVFTGDSLFPGGPGRTTSPDDFSSLMDDLEARIFEQLPDDTWFYPGHGDDSTLGAERPALDDWRRRGW